MICGSGPSGSLRSGRTAAAPEWRIISSCPVLPLGKRTVSMDRCTTLPSWISRLSSIPASNSDSDIGCMHLHRPQLEVAQRLCYLICSAHNRNGQPVSVNVFLRSLVDSLARYARNLFAVGLEV